MSASLSKSQIDKNKRFLKESEPRICDIFRTRKFWKLEAQEIVGDPDHYCDDDIMQMILVYNSMEMKHVNCKTY